MTSDLVSAEAEDLLLDGFRTLNVPKVVAQDVLAQNERTIEDRMASLRLYDPTTQAPTNAAVLLFGLDPLSSIPGAYIQFVRFDGADLGSAVLYAKSLTGNLITQLQELDDLRRIQIRTVRPPLEGLRHEEVPDYPLPALRELALNAVMHRSYEATSAPVRINWFFDRIEIQNPGGLYGLVIGTSKWQAIGYLERWTRGARPAFCNCDRQATRDPAGRTG